MQNPANSTTSSQTHPRPPACVTVAAGNTQHTCKSSVHSKATLSTINLQVG
jgi:hypothetical protein